MALARTLICVLLCCACDGNTQLKYTDEEFAECDGLILDGEVEVPTPAGFGVAIGEADAGTEGAFARCRDGCPSGTACYATCLDWTLFALLADEATGLHYFGRCTLRNGERDAFALTRRYRCVRSRAFGKDDCSERSCFEPIFELCTQLQGEPNEVDTDLSEE